MGVFYYAIRAYNVKVAIIGNICLVVWIDVVLTSQSIPSSHRGEEDPSNIIDQSKVE